MLSVLSPTPEPLQAVIFAEPVSPKTVLTTPQATCHAVPVQPVYGVPVHAVPVHTVPAPRKEVVVTRRVAIPRTTVVQQAPTPRVVEMHKTVPTQAVVLHVQGNVCVCGNTFMPDSHFCRKCGQPRPGHGGASPHGAGHAMAQQQVLTEILHQSHRLVGGAHAPNATQITHAPQRCMDTPGHH